MIIDMHKAIPGKNYSRIVSIVPSLTELLYDLGLQEEVVGITRFCIHPRNWHKNKARVGGTKNVKIAAIQQLEPDLIIANKEENVREQVEELAKIYDVLVTDVSDLAGATQVIFDIGSLVGKSTGAAQIAAKIDMKFNLLRDFKSLKGKRKAAYLVWKDPFMAAGNHTFINDMLQYCGLENVFSYHDRYPEINMEELRRDCALVLLSSEPYPFREKHRNEIIDAVPGVKVMLVDGEMFSWYGSRLLKAADYFNDLLLELAG
ncbi:MAG: helical backbone metal receptor [Ginsengibacter sp.]